MSQHFVLIHGAWHGGWCWDGVIRELENAGHTAVAPTLPGNNPDDDFASVTFADYLDTIAAVLEQQQEPVILVGHSSAGFLLQAVAPRAAKKIAHLVFHNAFILPNGASQLDMFLPEVAQILIDAAMTVATPYGSIASPDKSVPILEDLIRNALMKDDSTEVQNALLSRLVPQPFVLFNTKVNTNDFLALKIPRTVLFCKDDRSLPPGTYLKMAQSLGTYELIECPGGHETLFINPKIIADALKKITINSTFHAIA
ncbi:MAG: alpha/beta fold hydrolase [Nostoc sp.]|uniref:alpha/beta fold hydrolase n=1 Tax=Nostoc sp. TaxID=1180 RepID=UPI002FF7C808